jgi:hypothetical protein
MLIRSRKTPPRFAAEAGLLIAGVHPKVSQERLGHHSVAFTLDRYAHNRPAARRRRGEDRRHFR